MKKEEEQIIQDSGSRKEKREKGGKRSLPSELTWYVGVGGGGRGEGTSQRGNQRGQETGSAVGGWSDVDVFFLATMMLMLVITCGFSRSWCER